MHEAPDAAAMSSARRSALNRFTALEIDRCSERRDDLAWLQARWLDQQARLLVIDQRLRLLIEPVEPFRLSTLVPARTGLTCEQALFLGCRGDQTWFAASATSFDNALLPADSRFLDLRQYAARLDDFNAGLAAYARGMYFWAQRTAYCSVCGSPLLRASAGHRLLCSNSACGAEHFPRTDPAIITIVTHQNACLLARQAHWPERLYSTLAGFVEPGEGLEDAVRREVMEESGSNVLDCEYHSSQPWPFPASLMLGFTAHAESRELRLGDELEHAQWLTPEQLDASLADGSLLLPYSVSVSFRLIDHWYRQQTGRSLPETSPDV